MTPTPSQNLQRWQRPLQASNTPHNRLPIKGGRFFVYIHLPSHKHIAVQAQIKRFDGILPTYLTTTPQMQFDALRKQNKCLINK